MPRGKTGATKTNSSNKRSRKKNNGIEHVSSSHYLGYVEDNESIDMIMKKFQKLDEFEQKKKSKAEEDGLKDDNPLTEREMEDLFRETSAFNLQSVLNEKNDADAFGYGSDEDLMEDSEEEGWDFYGVRTKVNKSGEKVYIFSDDEDLFDELEGKPRKKSQGLAKKRSTVLVSEISVTAIPNECPVPESWGKSITQYVPESFIHTKTFWHSDDITNYKTSPVAEVPEGSELIKVKDILELDLNTVVGNRKDGFEGIIISPPWRERFGSLESSSTGIVPNDLLKLNLNDTKLIKAGFVYIWTPKHLAVEVLETLHKMNFFYVENACVVRQRTTNKLPSLADDGKNKAYHGQLFNQTHELLLIFRRGIVKASGKREWTKVEIRHQRTSDVKFEYFDNDKFANDYLYNLVETMVPLARYNQEAPNQTGRMLHLWGPISGARRTGWLSVISTYN